MGEKSESKLMYSIDGREFQKINEPKTMPIYPLNGKIPIPFGINAYMVAHGNKDKWIDVYCQGVKKIGIPCRRYLGKVEGKAELLCPICKTLNVVEGGKITVKERGNYEG